MDKETTEIPAGLSSPEQIERNCMRNLLASPEERVWFKDLESRFLLVSQGWLEAVAPGRTLDDIIGRTDFDIFSRPHAAAAFEDERQVIATGKAIVAKIECETFDHRPDAWVSTTKLPLRDEDGAIIGTWGIARDVTAQISAEQALVQQALHDPVTGLANRVALMDRLQQALVSLERRAGRVAVLFVDLDDFKDINDAFGHDAGDRVLVEVGRRLGEVARRWTPWLASAATSSWFCCHTFTTTPTCARSASGSQPRSERHCILRGASCRSAAASGWRSATTR